MKYFLYNPISGHGKSREIAENMQSGLEEKAVMVDMTAVDYSQLFSTLEDNDVITIFGGDGTLNRFINDTAELSFDGKVEYVPAGTGNDFYSDVTTEKSDKPIDITDHIKGLPTVTVNGKVHKFINGVGYGIDGYCCEVGDEMHRQGKVPNYTSIAIKGLLFHFKPRNAVVTVDGEEHAYKKVWIAPTMYGRRYGGGMIPTPDQKRGGADKKLSLMIFHGSSKLKTLMIFPSIFKGEHVKKKKFVEVIEGKNITVRFDAPTSLQIDGETILGVSEYSASI